MFISHSTALSEYLFQLWLESSGWGFGRKKPQCILVVVGFLGLKDHMAVAEMTSGPETVVQAHNKKKNHPETQAGFANVNLPIVVVV